MVYVKIPEPVTLCERTPNGERKPVRPMGMFDLIDWLTNDVHFSKPTKMGRVAAELCADFEKAKPGDYVRLTAEQHGHIKAVLESPAEPIRAVVLKQIVPLLDALLEPLSEEQYSKRAKSEEAAASAS
jgi:hypothetical protein